MNTYPVELPLEEIAKNIFSCPPEEPKKFQLYVEGEVTPANVVDIFEVFVTILMEGIDVVTEGIDYEKVKTFNFGFLDWLNCWTKSLGFATIVEQVPKHHVENYANYYCSIVLACMPQWKQYFDMKHITKKYHFILNGNNPFVEEHKIQLNELFAIFTIGEDVFKISFKCI